MASVTWPNISTVDADKLNAARRQAHNAVHWLVRLANSYTEPGDVSGQAPPVGRIMAKEIELRGSFRFDPEFDTALDLMTAGRVDLRPLLSHSLPLADAEKAFDLALDRQRAMKVQLVA